MSTQDWSNVDEAILSGSSSMEVWALYGRPRGLSLADVVSRKHALRHGQMLPMGPARAPVRPEVTPRPAAR